MDVMSATARTTEGGSTSLPASFDSATAIRLRTDTFVAYDRELTAAAVDAGLFVVSPGRADSEGDLR